MFIFQGNLHKLIIITLYTPNTLFESLNVNSYKLFVIYGMTNVINYFNL